MIRKQPLWCGTSTPKIVNWLALYTGRAFELVRIPKLVGDFVRDAAGCLSQRVCG